MAENFKVTIDLFNIELKDVVENKNIQKNLTFDYTINNKSSKDIKWINFDVCIYYIVKKKETFGSTYLVDGNTRYSSSSFMNTRTEYHKFEYKNDHIIPANSKSTIEGWAWYHNGFLEDQNLLIEEPFVYRAYGEYADGTTFNYTYKDGLNFAGKHYFQVTTSKRVGPCFVATWAFEDEFHPTVDSLRKFRDKTLLTRPLGRKFVSWYYRNGPKIVAAVETNQLLKKPSRFLLNCIVRILSRLGAS